MERRTFVIGIGGTVAGTGVIAGSGAFSQVKADRTMSVTVATDANSYLSLAEGTGDSSYTNVDANDNVEITFGALNEANGANDNAVSSFDALVEVGNNGNNQVTLDYTVTDSAGTDVTADVNLYTGSAGGTPTDLSGQTLAAYDTTNSVKDTLEFGVEIDTSAIAGDTYTITIEATQA
jgi:hypothetical protein